MTAMTEHRPSHRADAEPRVHSRRQRGRSLSWGSSENHGHQIFDLRCLYPGYRDAIEGPLRSRHDYHVRTGHTGTKPDIEITAIQKRFGPKQAALVRLLDLP